MRMFLLNHQQRVKKWLTDKSFIEATLIEQINAADQLKFSVPLKIRLPASYQFAIIPHPRRDDYLLFKIIAEQVKTDRIEYTCVEAAYDELKSYNYIKDIRPRDRSASEMLMIALQGTRWEAGNVSSGGRVSTNFYYINTLEAIQKIVKLYNLEAVFTVSLDAHNARVIRRRVNLYAQQGERTGKRFEYGSNLLTVEREESSENLVTALIGRGKGEEIYHNEDGSKTTIPTSNTNDAPDGYGRRINFADVVWSRSNGNPVDKPAGQEYVEDPNATAVYGFDDGKPRIGLQIFENITDKNELLQATWDALQILKRPKVSYKANVIDVGDLGLGDTVAIIRHDLQIEYFTRVYKVTHNLLDEKRNTIELGDDFSSNSMTSTIASMSSDIAQVAQTAGYAATSANGKNTNYYSKEKPALAVDGDLWYKDLGNGETDLYQYHDGNWILLTSTRQLNQAKKEIDDKLADLKKLDFDKGLDIDALNKKLANVETTANNAFSSGQKNQTDLQKLDGEITGRVSQVLNDGGYATQSWTQGQFKLAQDSFNVEIDNVLKTANGNADKISSLDIDLKGLKSTVATKADITEVNQKANEWSVKVTGLTQKLEERTGTKPNMLNGTSNWWGNWHEDPSVSGYSDYDLPVECTLDGTTDPEGNVAVYLPKGKATVPTKLLYLDKGTYTLSAWNYPDVNGKTGAQLLATKSKAPQAVFKAIKNGASLPPNRWTRSSWTYEVTKAGYVLVYADSVANHIASVKLEQNETDSRWIPSANDPFRATGETLSSINVDAGNILFKSNRIYLDADSTIFSGKAFIPSAAISELTADKITTGTLNAGNVNIINMNASNITTGTIHGTNLSIDLNAGTILFQHGKITSTSGSLNIDIDKATMSVTNWMGSGFYFSDGRMDLSDGLSPTADYKYGSIRMGEGNNMGLDSMTVLGNAGLALYTKGFNGGLYGFGKATSGAGIKLDNSSGRSVTIDGEGITNVQGGQQYTLPGEFMPSSPGFEIGINVNRNGTGTRTFLHGEYIHARPIYLQTTGNAPNVFVAQDGALVRSTSASKYKTDIKRSYIWDYGEKLLELPTATWTDKAELARYTKGESEMKPATHFGMIAEDLADAGLEMLVQRNPDGELEGIQYDRIGPALIPVIKNLKDRVEKLEEKLNEK